MCFLKFIPQTHPLHSSPLDITTKKPLPQDMPPTNCFSFHQQPAEQIYLESNKQMAMFAFIRQLALNSQVISALGQKINHSANLLNQTTSVFTEVRNTPDASSEHFHDGDSTNEERQTPCDPLTTKLFGNRTYKYRLVLASPVSDTLYKDRNFGLSFKLMNLSTGAMENNGNLVNVCLGVCDSNGQWVQQTREGTPLLKGKLETELYHGQGEFVKLSPRDVSRGFTGKKVTLVVYAKPTLLQYSGESCLEKRIDDSLIEPLLVKDICIKAKRRE